MQMQNLPAGKLRAIGYAAPQRLLRVELEGGITIDYANVDADTYRRFANSGVPWSFYRDNIEEEFHGTRSRTPPRAPSAELTDLFGTASTEPEPQPSLHDLFKKP